jgi:hypothetical protein
MKTEDFLTKCKTDLEEVMSSIAAIKGKSFVEILTIHINMCTLVTLIGLLEEEEINEKLHQMLTKSSLVCASSSLQKLSELANLSEEDVKEIIAWGDRLHLMMDQNVQNAKGNK